MATAVIGKALQTQARYHDVRRPKALTKLRTIEIHFYLISLVQVNSSADSSLDCLGVSIDLFPQWLEIAKQKESEQLI